MITPNTVMLSVRPEYASRILEGQKTYELRKTRPRIGEGEWILLYVSSPEKTLKALAVAGVVLTGAPVTIWRKLGSKTGLTRKEFNTYFGETSVAYAIEIKVVKEFLTPVPLVGIRKAFPGFHPPQIYQYFESAEASNLFSELKVDVEELL